MIFELLIVDYRPEGGDGQEAEGDRGAVPEGEGGGDAGVPAGAQEVRGLHRVAAKAGQH